MTRGDLTDNQWELLEPLLPPRKPQRGRPNADHRRIINAILWIDRTGSPGRELTEKYGPWRTVASRFYRSGRRPGCGITYEKLCRVTKTPTEGWIGRCITWTRL